MSLSFFLKLKNYFEIRCCVFRKTFWKLAESVFAFLHPVFLKEPVRRSRWFFYFPIIRVRLPSRRWRRRRVFVKQKLLKSSTVTYNVTHIQHFLISLLITKILFYFILKLIIYFYNNIFRLINLSPSLSPKLFLFWLIIFLSPLLSLVLSCGVGSGLLLWCWVFCLQ